MHLRRFAAREVRRDGGIGGDDWRARDSPWELGTARGDGGDDTWVFVEKVAPSDRSAWLSAKRAGAGRDPRLNEAGDGREADRVFLAVAFTRMKKGGMPNLPYYGPSAVAEVLLAIKATSLEPPCYLSH